MLFFVVTKNTYHPEEGSCGKVCILLYSRQNTEDQTHQDHEEAVKKKNKQTKISLVSKKLE